MLTPNAGDSKNQVKIFQEHLAKKEIIMVNIY
jgi:hypothetical protein